jgi:hypothetical protein
MNKLVEHYSIHVDFPEVSGAEHLEMLQLRDKILSMEETLTAGDKQALAVADRRLIELAGEFYAELSRFVDFEERRQRQQIPPNRWWWYLDVLAQLPHDMPSNQEATVA